MSGQNKLFMPLVIATVLLGSSFVAYQLFFNEPPKPENEGYLVRCDVTLEKSGSVVVLSIDETNCRHETIVCENVYGAGKQYPQMSIYPNGNGLPPIINPYKGKVGMQITSENIVLPDTDAEGNVIGSMGGSLTKKAKVSFDLTMKDADDFSLELCMPKQDVYDVKVYTTDEEDRIKQQSMFTAYQTAILVD